MLIAHQLTLTAGCVTMANANNVILDSTLKMVHVKNVLDSVQNVQVLHHVLPADQVKHSWIHKRDVSVKLVIIKTIHKD